MKDIGFALDVSGSVKVANWKKEQMFTKTIAKFASISESGNRVAAITFNKEPRLEIKFSDHKTYDGFADAVDDLEYRQKGTDIAAALRLSLDEMFQSENGMRSDSTKLMILITDGESDDSEFYNLRKEFESKNIPLIVVGVGNVQENELRKLVLHEKDLLIATDFDDLKTRLTNELVYTICPGKLSITIRDGSDLFVF